MFAIKCFLNDQYSSSFHVIGKQMKIIKLLIALSSGGAKHMSDWSSTCVGMASLQKLRCRHHTCSSAQGLLRNVTLQFHLRGWITIPGFPSKKKWNSTGWFCLNCPANCYRGSPWILSAARVGLKSHQTHPVLNSWNCGWLLYVFATDV